MNYVQNFLESLKNPKPQDTQNPSHISTRVIELSEQIKTWHETRPVPERWQPVQLGRLAAQLNASRDLTATALGLAGWIGKRSGTTIFYQPK